MEIHEIDKLMFRSVLERKKVKVVCKPNVFGGITVEGRPGWYTSADDEEDGYATFVIDFPDRASICVSSAEIQKIELLD